MSQGNKVNKVKYLRKFLASKYPIDFSSPLKFIMFPRFPY